MDEPIYTVGDLAYISGATVRTIQYYDQIGLLVAKRGGSKNARYYTKSDLVKLQQILFYKKLGMTLKEIKARYLNDENQKDFKRILEQQYTLLFKKQMEIKTSIAVIEAILSAMKTDQDCDLEAIIKLTLKLNQAAIFDYVLVEFDQETRAAFNEKYPDDDAIIDLYWRWKKLLLESFSLKSNRIEPKSESGYRFGKKWHAFVQTATDDNQKMVEAYLKSYQQSHLWPEEDKFLMDYCADFIRQAHQYYCGDEEEN